MRLICVCLLSFVALSILGCTGAGISDTVQSLPPLDTLEKVHTPIRVCRPLSDWKEIPSPFLNQRCFMYVNPQVYSQTGVVCQPNPVLITDCAP